MSKLGQADAEKRTVRLLSAEAFSVNGKRSSDYAGDQIGSASTETGSPGSLRLDERNQSGFKPDDGDEI